MQTTEISPSDFVEQFKNHKSDDKFVVVFYSGRLSDTNEFWCSDCVKAEPFVNDKLLPRLKDKNIGFSIVNCQDKETFRDPNFLLKESFNVSKVPTVAYYEKGEEKRRLEEEDVYSSKIESLI